MRILLTVTLLAGLAFMPAPAAAFDLEDALREAVGVDDDSRQGDLRTTQNGGLSLSEAIEQVRRQTGGQILSAKTKVNGNREVHHIKVLTKDGRVRTVRVQGRRRGG